MLNCSKTEPSPKTPTPALKKDVPILPSKKLNETSGNKSKPIVSASLDTTVFKNKTQMSSPQKNFSRNKSFVSSVKTRTSMDQPRRYVQCLDRIHPQIKSKIIVFYLIELFLQLIIT